MDQTKILIELSNLQHPFLDSMVSIFTFLGSETFYFLIIPFIYWSISKGVGIRLFYIVVFSVYVNSILKVIFAVERPIGTEGVQSKFLYSVEGGSRYPFDSFPSGHSQGSSTLWAYLAFVIRHPMFLILVVGLVVGISISRLYAGLHWPTDVLFGLIIGLVIALLGIYLQGKITRLPQKMHWILAILAPILLLVVFREEGMKYAGVLLGGGLGFLIEKKQVKMAIESSFLRKAVAFIIGIIVLFALQVGLKFVFPTGLLFDFLRYFILGVWIFLLAPLLFVACRIYRKSIYTNSHTIFQ